MSENHNCTICGGATFDVIDLGEQPFANALVDSIDAKSQTYPLKLLVCSQCSAAQLSYFADMEELYRNYFYATPTSSMLNEHYKLIQSLLEEGGHLSSESNLLEIGSNVGKLLEFIHPFVNSVVGVDPASNIAKIANDNGIPTVNDFFSKASAQAIKKNQGQKDIIIARHCFAHNEKPWLMIEGVNEILTDEGVFVVENAYFLDTIVNQEFDQIYHEHMYYYNLRSISTMFEKHGLKLVDALESKIHGGTMIYVAKRATSDQGLSQRAQQYLEDEKNMHLPEYYESFVANVLRNKKQLSELLDSFIKDGKTVHAYGASAKSTVLLNYYGITNTMVSKALDSTEIKHGRFIPGVNIEVVSEDETVSNPADYYLLTGWNYKDEIMQKVRSKGNTASKFIIPHPQVEVLEG